MTSTYIAFHSDIDEEDVENLVNVIVNNGFLYSDKWRNGLADVVICYEMGDDLPAGVEIYNEDVFKSKEVMDVLNRLEDTGEDEEE
jgi:hypothetical protein